MITDEQAMKRYFGSPGTVATWWREDEWHPVLKDYFDQQVTYVRLLRDWRGDFVLDAGTGYGRFATALAQAGARVCGVDISMEMLGAALRRQAASGYSFPLQRADVEWLPFRTGSFDAAVCMETLMHVPDPRAVVRELARVVRPGGLVLAGINNRFSLAGLLHSLHVHLALYRRLRRRPMVYRYHSVWALRDWLKDAGLSIVDEAGVGLLHPEVRLRLLPGVAMRLVPYPLARRLLALEDRGRLGHTGLRHFMKAIVVAARKGA